MLALVLIEAGLQPSFIIGGEVNEIGSGAAWDEGELFVVEADESEQILTRLFDLTEDPANTYEHVWQVDDLLMWDNLACLHARTDWPASQTRMLRRCTVLGERLW